MRRILLILLLLALGVAEADARRRGHRHQGYRHQGVPREYVVPREAPESAQPPMAYRGIARPPSETTGRAPAESPRAPKDEAELVPSDWQLQPPDPQWNGRRFMSPDGNAWVAFYASPADHEPVAAHLKTVAFVDGEEITFLRGERDWIAVSGVKGERVFYRKAVLACGGTKWHHAAFEYPSDAKQRMDQIVNRSARALESSKDYGCASEASSFPQ